MSSFTTTAGFELPTSFSSQQQQQHHEGSSASLGGGGLAAAAADHADASSENTHSSSTRTRSRSSSRSSLSSSPLALASVDEQAELGLAIPAAAAPSAAAARGGSSFVKAQHHHRTQLTRRPSSGAAGKKALSKAQKKKNKKRRRGIVGSKTQPRRTGTAAAATTSTSTPPGKRKQQPRSEGRATGSFRVGSLNAQGTAEGAGGGYTSSSSTTTTSSESTSSSSGGDHVGEDEDAGDFGAALGEAKGGGGESASKRSTGRKLSPEKSSSFTREHGFAPSFSAGIDEDDSSDLEASGGGATGVGAGLFSSLSQQSAADSSSTAESESCASSSAATSTWEAPAGAGLASGLALSSSFDERQGSEQLVSAGVRSLAASSGLQDRPRTSSNSGRSRKRSRGHRRRGSATAVVPVSAASASSATTSSGEFSSLASSDAEEDVLSVADSLTSSDHTKGGSGMKADALLSPRRRNRKDLKKSTSDNIDMHFMSMPGEPHSDADTPSGLAAAGVTHKDKSSTSQNVKGDSPQRREKGKQLSRRTSGEHSRRSRTPQSSAGGSEQALTQLMAAHLPSLVKSSDQPTVDRAKRLAGLFAEISLEFEAVWKENVDLRQQLDSAQQEIALLRASADPQVSQPLLEAKTQASDVLRRRPAPSLPSVPISTDTAASPQVDRGHSPGPGGNPSASTGSVSGSSTAASERKRQHSIKSKKERKEEKKQSRRPSLPLPVAPPPPYLGLPRWPPLAQFVSREPRTGASSSAAHLDVVWEVNAVPSSNISRSAWERHPSEVAFASCSLDRSVKLWSLLSEEPLFVYDGHHHSSVNSVRIHPRRRLVLTASGEGTCHVFKVPHLDAPGRAESSGDPRGVRIPSFMRPSGENSTEWKPLLDDNAEMEADDTELSDGETSDGTFVRPKTERIRKSELELHHTSVVSCAEWLPAGGAAPGRESVISLCWDGNLYLWDLAERGRVISSAPFVGNSSILSQSSSAIRATCAVDPHHKLPRVLISACDGFSTLWDFRAGRLSTSFAVRDEAGATTGTSFAAFDHINEHVALTAFGSGNDAGVKIWDLRKTKSPKASLRIGATVNGLAGASSAPLVAVPCDDAGVRIIDTQQEKQIAVMWFPPRTSGAVRMQSCAAATSAAWSADDSVVFVGSADGQVAAFARE